MDSALLAAIIGTLGGGFVTGGAALLRNRTSVRTAARLIYAELTRNSVAVAYFRQTGHWAAPNLSREAWDAHGTVLARRRSGASFEAVHRGYEALELAPFITNDTLSEAEREEWLSREATRLSAAIEEIGSIAQVPAAQIRDWTRRLEGPRPGRRSPHPIARAGPIPLSLLEALTQEAVPSDGFTNAGVALTDEGPKPLPDATSVADLVVFDAKGSKKTVGLSVARYTGLPPVGDPVVDETYDLLITTRRFFREVYGRARFPFQGGPLAAIVHYGKNYPNGRWDGYSLILGDGDGAVFQRFSKCPEVIAGEATWGLEEMLYFVSFQGEEGALARSHCDVFGSLVKQWSLGQSVIEADWIMGSGLLAPGRQGLGLRSLKAPGTAYDDNVLGKDPQAAHMDGYVVTNGNEGNYINCGIPNHAFYLLATGLGGRAWERAGQIWWDALTGDGLRDGLHFADWARRTITAARVRYGEESEEERVVLDAWSRVGVTPSAQPAVAGEDETSAKHSARRSPP
ncbi:M4 family metallopeptidase [Streptomyces sp. NPDC093982]|uniref:M4 family metallopeptidase n=1 Tax=Streptomyces sp. NPDC093982 TaxID=3155077 RepID=UPI0034288B6B